MFLRIFLLSSAFSSPGIRGFEKIMLLLYQVSKSKPVCASCRRLLG